MQSMIARRVVAAIALLCAAFVTQPALAGDAVGVRMLSLRIAIRARPVGVTLWYPARPGGTPVAVGANGVFQGAAGQRDAPFADGVFPVVLVSHGGMRAAANLGGWLDRALAARGFVVADVHAARLGPGDAAKAPAEIWRRPADLSAALSLLERDPRVAPHLDAVRVGAVGFFLGGTAILSLAGARLDAARYAATCDPGGSGIDCAWFAEAHVDLHAVDAARLAGAHADPRIKVAIAVDPELSDSFSAASLHALTVPVEIVGLGRPGAMPPGLDAAGLARANPRIGYRRVAGANWFDGFALCRPKGAAILAASGATEALCQSNAGRARIHAKLARLIAGLLRAHLPPAR